ncbi:MAG: DUF29 domain-containing protein [Gomphosphaeria aponina SAG 52.96 = DSM 107014]|uniref:DUF29 domain-containing protein n=1 Tax=Gomphosphaeria aponina SAG 52.96 = DSM 107014 TaxID=1521640 RepID=A0A941GWN8_9CHRO|nr:DUF29 domain-containing protein [Gomphosphaeria aponina SAG 52.96 = DSM 107014]
MTNKLLDVTKKKLYNQDFHLWLENTVKQIKRGELNLVDWENLLEELESLGKSNQRELKSRLTVLLEHLLKLVYWEEERENNVRGWKGTIIEQRKQIEALLDDSPSLKLLLEESFSTCYANARKITIVKTGLQSNRLPEESPFNLANTLEESYLLD